MAMKRPVKIVGGVVATLVLLLVALVGWASMSVAATMSTPIDTHTENFPIPFPLTPAELAELGIETDEGNRIALERAIERGSHLVNARYACAECHGADFGGGVMVDQFPVASFLGPNLTTGEGSRTVTFTASDWDRTVRHGVLADGMPSVMPAQDFELMSDQELSDIVSYIRSFPPIASERTPPEFHPVGRILAATGQMPLPATLIASHTASHATLPPPAAVSTEFGRHLAGVCTGCHGQDLAGGVIVGGDPAWPPAMNITPHEDGLAGWSLDDFRAALQESVRPTGEPLIEPMTFVAPFAANMTDTEIEALFVYLQSVTAIAGN